MSASFLLFPLLHFLWRRWDTFLLFLLQAAQRIGIALFPLPLLPPPLPILLADALLLLQAADTLVLGRAHQLSQLDSLDVVEGRLVGLVQHDGVENDVEQRDAWDLLQACSHLGILENTNTIDDLSLVIHKSVELNLAQITEETTLQMIISCYSLIGGEFRPQTIFFHFSDI